MDKWKKLKDKVNRELLYFKGLRRVGEQLYDIPPHLQDQIHMLEDLRAFMSLCEREEKINDR